MKNAVSPKNPVAQAQQQKVQQRSPVREAVHRFAFFFFSVQQQKEVA
jgi:hypothetical protein